MFALADCNNFFVSCERVFHPELRNKPVIVLSNNDGCAISRSNEAKALGIKMGAPLFQIKDLVARNHVAVFSSNFALYGDMSDRVQETLRQMAPAIEVYSIDEAFLDLRGMEGKDLEAFAREASARCLKHTGIPVSVGVAPTKTLAKIASKCCKEDPALRGGFFLSEKAAIEEVLKRFPIDDVWGIGRQHTARLKFFGVKTAFDFTRLPAEWIRQQMNITGWHTQQELLGFPCIDFAYTMPPKQQICVSRSFAKEIRDYNQLAEQISLFTSMVCEKLRKQKSVCHQVLVFLLTDRFKPNNIHPFESRMVTFPVATDSTLEINTRVLSCLSSFYHKGYGYKKGGVILTSLSPNQSVQLDLYDSTDRQKHTRLMKTMDKINTQIAPGLIGVGSQSPDGVIMNRRHLSPQYTTRWSDILTVKA